MPSSKVDSKWTAVELYTLQIKTWLKAKGLFVTIGASKDLWGLYSEEISLSNFIEHSTPLLYINFGMFLHKVQKRYATLTRRYSADHPEDYLCNWTSRVSVGVKTTLNLTTILCTLSLSEPIHKLSGLFYTQNIQLPCNRSYYLVYFGVRCVSATISLGFPSCNQCLLAKMIMQCHFALLQWPSIRNSRCIT